METEGEGEGLGVQIFKIENRSYRAMCPPQIRDWCEPLEFIMLLFLLHIYLGLVHKKYE